MSGISGLGGYGGLPIEPEGEPEGACPSSGAAAEQSGAAGAAPAGGEGGASAMGVMAQLQGALFPRSAWSDRGAFDAVMRAVRSALDDVEKAAGNWRSGRTIDARQQQGGEPISEDPPIRALYGLAPGTFDPTDTVDTDPVVPEDPPIRALYGLAPGTFDSGDTDPVAPEDPPIRALYGLAPGTFPGSSGGDLRQA